jgi:quinol monooxygenase YgiN
MAVRLVVIFMAQHGKGEAFADAFAPVIKDVQQEKGCEQYELFRGTENPDKLVLLERWTSPEDLDAHMGLMRARGPSPTAEFRAEGFAPSLERYEV